MLILYEIWIVGLFTWNLSDFLNEGVHIGSKGFGIFSSASRNSFLFCSEVNCSVYMCWNIFYSFSCYWFLVLFHSDLIKYIDLFQCSYICYDLLDVLIGLFWLLRKLSILQLLGGIFCRCVLSPFHLKCWSTLKLPGWYFCLDDLPVRVGY
jgi:hypothetical protein